MNSTWNESDVSTHSRLKAAGRSIWRCDDEGRVSTHSRLKAAGDEVLVPGVDFTKVSTHSRLKAAGCKACHDSVKQSVSTHSRLKAAGPVDKAQFAAKMFQHTAA